MEKIKLRGATESDMNFIYNSWLKSYKNSLIGKTMTNDVFFTNHKQVISEILNSPLTSIVVAVSPEDNDQILGFACIETSPSYNVLHYVYVKFTFRKFGIASSIIDGLGGWDRFKFVTHLPKNWKTVSRKHNVHYNPYLVK